MHTRLAHLPRRELPGGLVIIEATTARPRLLGLIGIDSLAPGLGLELRAGSIHTFGVRMDLDLVWRDQTGQVIRVDRDVAPRRIRACHGARTVLELRAGSADAFLAALMAPSDASTSGLPR